jgi:glutaredoxin
MEGEMTHAEGPARDTTPALIVYGTGWCPDLRRSRALLDSTGVAYQYVDLDEDKAATKLVRRLQRGHRRVPTLVWPDGAFLVEPTDDELADHLTRKHAEADSEVPPAARRLSIML